MGVIGPSAGCGRKRRWAAKNARSSIRDTLADCAQSIEAACQVEILLGHAADIMCGEAQGNRRVGDRDVGMMADLFRHLRHAVYEPDTRGKRGKREALAQRALRVAPCGEVPERGLYLVIAQLRHRVPCPFL